MTATIYGAYLYHTKGLEYCRYIGFFPSPAHRFVFAFGTYIREYADLLKFIHPDTHLIRVSESGYFGTEMPAVSHADFLARVWASRHLAGIPHSLYILPHLFDFNLFMRNLLRSDKQDIRNAPHPPINEHLYRVRTGCSGWQYMNTIQFSHLTFDEGCRAIPGTKGMGILARATISDCVERIPDV